MFYLLHVLLPATRRHRAPRLYLEHAFLQVSGEGTCLAIPLGMYFFGKSSSYRYLQLVFSLKCQPITLTPYWIQFPPTTWLCRIKRQQALEEITSPGAILLFDLQGQQEIAEKQNKRHSGLQNYTMQHNLMTWLNKEVGKWETAINSYLNVYSMFSYTDKWYKIALCY